MNIKVKYTRVYISKISILKEKEIQYYSSKTNLLKRLMLDYPYKKTYGMRYKIALLRLKNLLNTSKELEQLDLDIIKVN